MLVPFGSQLGERQLEPRHSAAFATCVDALVLGETHEWELVEYAQDMISSGKKKALIVLGHVVSEQIAQNG